METAAETTQLVSAAVAPLHAEPRASSEQVSQSVAGHAVTVLETRDGWRMVRLEDGYEGWMHEGYLGAKAFSPREAAGWSESSRHSLGCTVLDATTKIERAYPLGARVAHDAKLVAGAAVDESERRHRYPGTGAEICASAARWFAGTSYQWGGITPWGADCSGMVQAVFRMHGVPLPRDARQQALLGTELAREPSAWRAGDLLFFSERADGRITHVAMAASSQTLMHVGIGRGGFAIERLAAAEPYTVALMGRLRSARRVLPA